MIPLPSEVSTIAPLEAALDAADHAERVAWIRRLGARELRVLWQLCEGRDVPVSFTHGEDGETVILTGQNSLPLFDRFEKRVMRRGDVVQGYNHQAMSWITGPGHFTVVADRGTAVFDYVRQPTTVPGDFPAIRSWFYGVSWFAYANMRDYLRRVSANVVVGQAEKWGRPMSARFVLVRPPSLTL